MNEIKESTAVPGIGGMSENLQEFDQFPAQFLSADGSEDVNSLSDKMKSNVAVSARESKCIIISLSLFLYLSLSLKFSFCLSHSLSLFPFFHPVLSVFVLLSLSFSPSLAFLPLFLIRYIFLCFLLKC